MSSFREAEEQREAPAANQWCWQRLSPNHLDHRQRVPTAITLHRLVPHPPPSLHQADNTTTSRSTFKYITPEDIKTAQIKARQEILASKQVSLASPPPPPSSDTRAPPLSKNKKQSHKKESPGSRPFFPCRLDNGETGLRRRQLIRLLSQISQTLGDLQDLKDSRGKDFVTPLDLEIKRQRWTECVRSLRRSLFALKQEVVILEGKRGHGKRNSRYLRALAATARTLNIQLMALKSQAESSGGELPWTEVFREFLGVAHRVLVLTASVGVQPPPSSLKWARSPQKGASLAPDDSSGLESTLSILDAGPTSVPLLQSKHVRNRLASLAALHLKRKKEEGDDKATNWTSANKIPTPKPSAPKTSFRASQSLRTSPSGKPNPSPQQTNISTSPQPTSFQTNNSAIDPQPSLSQTNISSIQPQPSPSQDNISPPQCQLPPPQNDNTEAPHPPSSSHERNNLMPQTSPLAPDLTQQLSFLLEKVCRIEDNRRRTEALISEAPQICQSQSVIPSLACAVQRAKLALASVTGSAPYSQVPLPKNEGSYTPGNPLFGGTGLSPKVSKEGLVRASSHPAIQDHSTEEIEETANQFGIKWLAGDSVTDQVRRQKEKFWLSLAERGYVRPPESLPLSEEEASVKGTVNSASEERAREEFVRTSKKTGVPIEPSQKNAASRAELPVYQQTSKYLTKQTQCSHTSGSSYSSSLSSNPNSRTQQSSPEKHSKPSITAGNKTKSHSSEEQIQQSMCVDSNTSSRTASTTESHTFPSYEGISSHE
ncbi:uncharacterized protein LOC127004399 isoform X1 [Eriocheir sinensis]|uniref:uncharacterized protein LOC127004399 isoform X1 n=1 Tax=Eriocheir sinensis TaxID=95602 RepID=UPI0021C8A163|nr:uncharacterized protein LOC127004399 isoform X1 [Eriocheir sinensis]